MHRLMRTSAALVLTAALGGLGTASAHAAEESSGGEAPAPPGLVRMHELMTQGNPGMARMHELMMQGNPGMARMCELM